MRRNDLQQTSAFYTGGVKHTGLCHGNKKSPKNEPFCIFGRRFDGS
jgi:hypothetical protein